MGTRHTIMVKDKMGVLKVCQYGQWDGYPEGQGVNVLDFCNSKTRLKKLEKVLPEIKFYNDTHEIDEWVKVYENCAPEWSKDPDNRTESMKYWWDTLQHRDIGANILRNLISIDKDLLPTEHKKTIYLRNEYDFFLHGWCEWAYLINFQTGKLEVYEDNDFLKKEFDLYNLPTKKEFIKELTTDESEEEF